MAAEVPGGEITGWSRSAAASASSDTFILDGHGLETDTPVTVRAPDVEGVSLPSPLVEGTVYYAIRISASAFSLSATVGGAAINLTESADEVFVGREPEFDNQIEYYSRWADGILPAHLVPLTAPIHPLVRRTVAKCTAQAMLNQDGKSSALVAAQELAAKAILERYAAGLPLRGAPVTAPANLAITDTSATASDPRGWGCSERIP